MAIVRMTMDEIRKVWPKEKAYKEIEEAAKYPIVIDEDCPEITPDLIGTRFIPADRTKAQGGSG